MDRGLKLTKPGVSLERKPGRTGTHRSDPLDPDLAAEDVTIRVLILAAGTDLTAQEQWGRGAVLSLRRFKFRGGASPETRRSSLNRPSRGRFDRDLGQGGYTRHA